MSMSYEEPFPIGSFQVRRVSFTAGAMGGILRGVIRSERSSLESVWHHYVKEAQQFINLALEAAEFRIDGSSPENPSLSFKAYEITLNVMPEASIESIENMLKRFSRFLTRMLLSPWILSEEELKTANQLLIFFSEIEKAGAEIDFNFPTF